jgi:hypothetical protein
MLACPFCGRRSRGATDLGDHLEIDHVGMVRPGHLTTFRPWLATMRGTLVVPVDPAFRLTPAFGVGAVLSHQAQFGMEVVSVPERGGETAARVYLRSAVHRAHEIGAPSSRWSLLDPAEAGEALVQHLDATGPDLVCMSAGHEAPGALGVVTRHVVERSGVPVVVMGSHGVVPDRINRIVVLEGGSTTVAQVIEPLVALGRRIGSEVVITRRSKVPAGSLVAIGVSGRSSLAELVDLVDEIASPVLVLRIEDVRLEA